jgi:hypothetical protein
VKHSTEGLRCCRQAFQGCLKTPGRQEQYWAFLTRGLLIMKQGARALA